MAMGWTAGIMDSLAEQSGRTRLKVRDRDRTSLYR
jgi:hypothetical protein